MSPRTKFFALQAELIELFPQLIRTTNDVSNMRDRDQPPGPDDDPFERRAYLRVRKLVGCLEPAELLELEQLEQLAAELLAARSREQERRRRMQASGEIVVTWPVEPVDELTVRDLETGAVFIP